MTQAPPVATGVAEQTRRAEPADTFDSLDPRTGAVIGTFPIATADDVAAAVARARAASAWWASLSFEQRGRRLRRLRALLTHRMGELIQLVSRETGKPTVDALIEVMLVLEHLDWAARHARGVLGRRRVGGSLLLANHRAELEYQPVGVVGVIGPWNYPVFTPMGSIVYALAAGNAVVFKPSEYTPAVGVWLARAVQDAIPEYPVLQTVTGRGGTGDALCRSGVDKISFTGSTATARTVLHTCAESLTPVLLELGGKDAFLVGADADLERAAKACVWGGLSNAGQTCIGVERVYVAAPVYDAFVDRVAAHARTVRAGTGADAAIGPITMPAQVEVIRRHLDDALARGARAVVGGADSVRRDGVVEPVVLVDVPADALVMREETFGPVLPITRVADLAEAVRFANDSPFGLGAAIWTARRDRGVEIARALRGGMASVNGVLAFAGIPALPFGGVGDSGFGRIHGADGLREFTRPKAITVERFPTPLELLVFDRKSWLPGMLERFLQVRYGRG